MSLEGLKRKQWRRVLLLLGIVSLTTAFSANTAAEPQRRTVPRTGTPVKRPAPKVARTNYSLFSHTTHVTAQKLACDSCHKFPTKNWKDVRKADAAFADVAEFPEHSSCLKCHRTQFFARQRPAPAICANCHVNVSPRDTTRFLFPSLGDIADSPLKRRDVAPEFGVAFPHDKHIDVVGMSRPKFGPEAASQFVNASWRGRSQKPAEQPKSCPVCHQLYQPQGSSSEEYVTKPPKGVGDNFWLKKGTFETIPNSHTACFTCHNAESGIPPDSKDCDTCHKLLQPETLKVDFDPKAATDMGIMDKTILDRWSHRISAGAFRHEGGEHPNLSCTTCHNVAVMNTVDQKTMKVPVMSCGGADGCHVTATSDDGGALNFEIDQKKASAGFVCMKCHIVFGREAVPASHVAAIPIATPK